MDTTVYEWRTVTNQILKMVESGMLDKDTVIAACLSYMSEAEVADMAHINGFLNEEVHDEQR